MTSGRINSVDSPIKVFWVQDEAHGAPGRLGLTFAPGKKGAGISTPAGWDRDLNLDMQHLKDVHGTDLLVSLMQDYEYDDLHIPDLFEVAAACGIATEHFPITDTYTPRADQDLDVDNLIRRIRGTLTAGKTVVIHCRGGHGRTGTIAALVLLSYGNSAEDAIRIVRVAQPNALENYRQTGYVEATAARWREAATGW